MSEKLPLVWMDMEMTGLDPDRERILEIATVVTDAELEIVAEGPELILVQPEEILAGMDDWNREHHSRSGLLERVRAATLTELEAQRKILEFLAPHCEAGQAPLAGNSVHQDRAFLRRYLPGLHAHLHYRNVDVSTVKELVRRWAPEILDAAPAKRERHRALEDIRESIAELRYYRQSAFRI